ncbi:hypothetical protein [Thioalkalivibrio sp. ALE30]|uniref:hypothetical protein n=1 Tax=Thioalkalivibrio sp. ALE30 TaxID=1158181 RepID=UPI00036EAFBB|nr:hypothetical protein [Thioalkalivibrio sp. ALE30]
MFSHSKKRTLGITLIEALIALAVIGLGILALSKLYGDLMVSTADSKARAEAVQVMESRIDNMRDSLTETDFDLAKDALTEDFTGTNASFRFELDEGTINSLDGTTTIELTALWDNARDEEQSVRVASILYWTDPLLSLNQARGRLPGGQNIASPSGDARTGGDPIDPADATDLAELPDDRGFGRMEMRADDDRRQLVRIDSDGTETVLLETDLSLGFSTISGLVVRLSSSNQFNTLRARVSDSGYCVNNNIPEFEPESFFYRCYVGRGWFGNIAVRDSQIDVSDQDGAIAVGDPEFDLDNAGANEPLITEPSVSIRRAFRGSGIWQRAELGMTHPLVQALVERDSVNGNRPTWLPPEFDASDSVPPEMVTRGGAGGPNADYADYFNNENNKLVDFGQHFVFARITGQRTPAQAKSALRDANEEIAESLDWDTATDGEPLADNAGEFYRLWCDQNDVTCPGFSQ